MKITISTKQGRVPVTILSLEGDLDSSSYLELIEQARKLFDDGARSLVLDLADIGFMSSAGLMAIHTISLMFAGKKPDQSRPFRAINLEHDEEARKHVKLLCPQPHIEQILDTVGLKQFFQIYTDLESAVNSF